MKEKLLITSGATFTIISILMMTNVFDPFVILHVGSPVSWGEVAPTDGSTLTQISSVAVWVEQYSANPADTEPLPVDSTVFRINNQNYAGVKSYRYTWQATIDPPIITSGTYNWVWTAYVGSESDTKTGSYTVASTPLTGKWYINDIEITSPTQEVRSRDRTVNFKFVKTSTFPDDSLIRCSVAVSGVSGGLLTWLTNTAAGTWTGSYTFTDGTYNLELRANAAGQEFVIMSLLGLTIGTPWFPKVTPISLTLLIIGIVNLIVGVIYLKRKK